LPKSALSMPVTAVRCMSGRMWLEVSRVMLIEL
jgi:hypothetical protein